MTSDKTVQGSVRRWAAAANYNLVWDAPTRLDAPINGDLLIPAGNLKDAVRLLLVGLSEKGYALDADFYSDGVIRLSPAGSTAPAAVQGAPTSTAQPSAPTPATLVVSPIQQAIEPASQQRRDRRASNSVAEGQWQMLQGDGNVERMLSRWARQARATVVWSATDRPRIIGCGRTSHRQCD